MANCDQPTGASGPRSRACAGEGSFHQTSTCRGESEAEGAGGRTRLVGNAKAGGGVQIARSIFLGQGIHVPSQCPPFVTLTIGLW